jgi:hypothetical protein
MLSIIGLITGGVDFTQKFATLDSNHYESLDTVKKLALPLSPMVISAGDYQFCYYWIVCLCDRKSG